jgi:hypothetical protein
MVQFAGDNNLPANSSFSFGAAVVAVTDAEHGTVHASNLDQIAEFKGEGVEPLIESKGEVAAVVGADDSIWAADMAAGTLSNFALDDAPANLPMN